ncbi:hypothetical protein CEXT_283531 [Caerostris extrusa]|uniref:Uncharacterized protein n=1 Tax=Caerostris extrusa TaxID=172846 RepID=A0AAV4WUB9_CAEEX|nr:hypothetical protein CEXT_283531 [Caerostris extrusa]
MSSPFPEVFIEPWANNTLIRPPKQRALQNDYTLITIVFAEQWPVNITGCHASEPAIHLHHVLGARIQKQCYSTSQILETLHPTKTSDPHPSGVPVPAKKNAVFPIKSTGGEKSPLREKGCAKKSLIRDSEP